MSDPAPSPANATVAPATCFDCGYDLRGLPEHAGEARCPECGSSVAESAEKYDRLREGGAVAPVRRGTKWLVVALAAGVTMLLLTMLFGFGAEYEWWSDRVFETLVPALAAVATLAMAASAWRAAATLRAAKPPGERAAGRVLTLTAWVIPVTAGVLWSLYWFDNHAARFPDSGLLDAVAQAMSMLLTSACVLYGPALLWVLYNRVRLWPRAIVLPRLLRGVTLMMFVGIVLTLPMLGVLLAEEVTGSEMNRRGPVLIRDYRLGDLALLAASAGWLAYSLAIPAAMLLVASVFGRVGKLAKSLAVAPAEEVGKERQASPVIPQPVGVE